MRILITGARGFVGNFIANHLKEKHILLTPTSQELNLTDLTQVNSWFENNKIDAIVHCALSGREVLSSTDPQYLSDGLLMFRNLWLHRDQYKQFINLGTAYEFDLSKNNFNVKEHEFIDHLPTTSYGYSKNVIARIIRDTHEFYNLRLFGVFHETESPLRFFKRVINQDQIIINNDQLLDYIYLPDIMPMIDTILDGNAQERDINMVYHNKYRLSELAYFLCEHLGISQSKIKVAADNGCHLTGDGTKLSSYNFPLVGIKNGLKNYK